MGLNVVQKILQKHLVEGSAEPGREIGIRIDQTLTQDATGTMAYLQFEALGLDGIKNELAVSYVDHNTVQIGPENADDHAFLRSAAQRFGAVFSRPGNGICHQLHLERFGVPGKTLLGSDSHTPTAGGIGMIGIGAGGLDVAVAMGGALFYLACPRVVKIELTGEFVDWVSAKDVALKVLEIFGTKGNVGTVFEYGGSALAHLDVPARATIANMGAECGVTTSVFPSDGMTKKFLAAQGREEAWREVVADKDAVYDDTIRIDLGEIEPLAAAPHSPGNVVAVSSLAGTKVNQVMIGSCTNSSYRDLKMVAELLRGKTIHPDVSVGIAPGSRQVLQMLAEEGALADLIRSGVRVLESACGFCIGNSMSPGTEGVSLRTSNRNFLGRSGTRLASIFLVSPETAAVAALAGSVVDARNDASLTYPHVTSPKEYLVDDSMFLPPPQDRRGISIIKGPGIGQVPVKEPLPDTLEGVVAIKVGDKITTDHIIPAGRRMKYRSNIDAYSKFVFENVDPEFAGRAESNRNAGVWSIILAGESYGQGSSREHAALCPMVLGVRAVLAKSFERIHHANLLNFGILPLRLLDENAYEVIDAQDTIRIDGLLSGGGASREFTLEDRTKGHDFRVCVDVTDREWAILACGGKLSYVRDRLAEK